MDKFTPDKKKKKKKKKFTPDEIIYDYIFVNVSMPALIQLKLHISRTC